MVILGKAATVLLAVALTLGTPNSIAHEHPHNQCFRRKATMNGTLERDVMVGTSRSDVMRGRGGNDHMFAGAGRDFVCGGTADDYIDAGRGYDRVSGGPGIDTCVNAERAKLCEVRR